MQDQLENSDLDQARPHNRNSLFSAAVHCTSCPRRLRQALAETLSLQGNGYSSNKRGGGAGVLASLESPVARAIRLLDRMVLGGDDEVRHVPSNQSWWLSQPADLQIPAVPHDAWLGPYGCLTGWCWGETMR